MSTDQIVADGRLTLRAGSAGLEILPSVLTEPDDASVVSFTRGTADIYDLGPTLIGPVSGALDVGIGGGIALWVGGDLASVTDFAFYPATESDPAMAIAVADNNGTVSGAVGAAWSRHFMTLYAPTDSAAWKRAAYAAVGLVYKAVPAGGLQYLDDVQWEIAPVSSNVPQAYSPARSIDVRVRPTRLNHATNPSFEEDLTDWTVAGGTLTRITTDAAVGTACCQASDLDAGDFVAHVVKSLVPGRSYTASIYLRSMDGGDAGIEVRGDSSGTVVGSMTWQTAPRGDAGSPDWRRVWVAFTALASAATVVVRSLGSTTVLLDGLLVEEGNGLGDYFDGDSGSPDYVWELDATPGKARSYYYRNKIERHYALGKTLNENVAQGLFVGDPEYATSAISVSTPYGSGPYGSGPYGG
jgi:hypothetical protein